MLPFLCMYVLEREFMQEFSTDSLPERDSVVGKERA